MTTMKYVLGNTGCLFCGGSCIPFYRMFDGTWVLIDSGPRSIREELQNYLDEHGIRIRAVLCSHAHFDHTENNQFLQQKYGAEIVMSLYDAAVLRDADSLKSVFYAYTRQENEKYNGEMICKADRFIFPEQEQVEVDNVSFQILRLPGHAASQLGFVTPDQVAYLADSIFQGETLTGKKLIYMLNWEEVFDTMKKIRTLSYPQYILAHSGSCKSVELLVEENERQFRSQLEEFERFLCDGLKEDSVSQDQLIQAAALWYDFKMGSYRKVRVFEWIIRSMAEYYLEEGKLYRDVNQGVAVYCLRGIKER